MTSNDSDGRTTRRQTLQATLGGAATLTVGAGLAAAGTGTEPGCDVTEAEREAVRETYADPDLLAEALDEQDDVKEALNENDLVEGEMDFVGVYAPVVDCEPVPEYRILRQTAQGGGLTINIRPESGEAYAMYKQLPDDPPDDDWDDPCEHLTGPCSCAGDPCCSCWKDPHCGCEGARVPCDTYCCWRCNCGCDWDACPEHCIDYYYDPTEVALLTERFEDIVKICC